MSCQKCLIEGCSECWYPDMDHEYCYQCDEFKELVFDGTKYKCQSKLVHACKTVDPKDPLKCTECFGGYGWNATSKMCEYCDIKNCKKCTQ